MPGAARLRGRQLDPDVVDAFCDLDPASLIDLPADWVPEPEADGPAMDADLAVAGAGVSGDALLHLS